MRRCQPLALLVVATALLGACGGPIGPIPGGRLRGTVVTVPIADWSFAAPARRLQLETRPEDPHSVTVGFALAEGRLYIDLGARSDRHCWRRFVRDDPRVRVRFGTRVYTARVEPVFEPGELAAARSAFGMRGSVPNAGAAIGRVVGESPVSARTAGRLLRSTRE